VLKAMMIMGMLSLMATGLGRCALLVGLNIFLIYFF
jgi:hypothetical protein